MPESVLSLPERITLAAFAGTAIAAFAHAQSAPGAFALLLPVVVSVSLAPPTLPPRLRRPLLYAARLWVAGFAGFALLSSIYPIFEDVTIARAGLVAGYGLAAFSTIFLLCRRAWPIVPNALACSVGTLAAASLHPTASLRAFHVAAVGCLLAYAGASAHTIEHREAAPRNRVRRAVRSLLYAGVVGALSLGLVRFLPWAQPRVEEATARALVPAYAISQPAFSEHARLGTVEQLALSHRVALRMWSRQAQKLRARVLVDFDGQSWHGARTPLRPFLPASDLPEDVRDWLEVVKGTSFTVPGPLGAEADRMRIVPVLEMAGPVMVPGGTRVVRIPGTSLLRDGFDIVQAVGEGTAAYALIHGPAEPTADASGLPPAQYLAVRDNTDPRLRALAARLSEGTATPEERVARTTGYLGRELRYSLTPGRFQSTQPVAEFVFEKKKGYCEYFASAAAVLLRLQGVPSRYVSGFSPREAGKVAGHYVIRESDAHAWIEVFMPGRGWVEVDPTPADQLAEFREAHGPGAFDRAWDGVKALVAALRARAAFGGWQALVDALRSPAALVAALLALAAVAARAFGRPAVRRWFAPTALSSQGVGTQGPPEIAALLAELDAAWSRSGYPRPPHRGPLEHLQAAPPPLFSAAVAETSARAVDCVYAVRFGGRPVPAMEVDEIRRALRGWGRTM